MNHCQVQVPDGSGRTWTYVNANGYHVENPMTCYCKEQAKYQCDSGFKFCEAHKKSHGTRGKDGHIHSFKKLKLNGSKRQ